MTNAAQTSTAVLVAGDVGVDVDIYLAERGAISAAPGQDTRLRERPGGAGLLSALLSWIGAHVPDGRRFAVDGPVIDDDDVRRLRRTFSLWQPVPATRGSTSMVWRVTQSLGRSGGSTYVPRPAGSETPDRYKAIVLVDDAHGFRHRDASASWPALLRGEAGPVPSAAPAVVILQMAAPICAGDLWQSASTRCQDRLVAVVAGTDLRRESIHVSKGVSWERTALDLAREFSIHSMLGDLARACRNVIVSLGVDGAFLVSREAAADGAEQLRFRLMYDPSVAEDELRLDGEVPGVMSCMTASIASHLVHDWSDESLQDGIVTGLSAMRALRVNGHGPVGHSDPGFPLDLISAPSQTSGGKDGFAATSIPSVAAGQDWTIMTSGDQLDHVPPLPLYGAAHRVALHGPSALGRIPHARFGRVFTVDRVEIEGLRTVAQLIDGYRRQNRGETPLSLGVFGPPGSGKSFCVKQVARAVCGDGVPVLEFNLSQFMTPADLIGAFHQIRDKVLEGTMPFVFWDEFDSQEYRWLQYLLAPMQDGRFTENQIARPIGKCVFVCAGGTSYDFANFGPPRGSAEYPAFRLKKGPDFKSRLAGHIDVLGPNRRQLFDESARDWVVNDERDVCFPVRRALLLRSTLGLSEGDSLRIDSAVLAALLEIPSYTHGARSLQKVVSELAQRSDGGVLRRSALPPSDVLSMHMDHDEFLRAIDRAEEIRSVANELAPRIHEYWRPLSPPSSPYNVQFDELPQEIQSDNRAAAERLARVLALVGLRVVRENEPGRDRTAEASGLIDRNLELLAEEEHEGWSEHRQRNGWRYGERRDDEAKRHPSLRPYHQLSHQEQDKDRNAVRRYPELVRSCGYKLVLIANAS